MAKKYNGVLLIEEKDMPEEFEVVAETALRRASSFDENVIEINDVGYRTGIAQNDQFVGYYKVEMSDADDKRYYAVYRMKSSMPLLVPIIIVGVFLIGPALFVFRYYYEYEQNDMRYQIRNEYESLVTDGDDIILKNGILNAVGISTKGNAEIPSTVEYSGKIYNVVCIGDEAFECENKLESVSIPESVTDIGKNAFRGCYELKSVIIPDSVEYIGRSAFENTGITTVRLPDSLAYFGGDSFLNCEITEFEYKGEKYQSIDDMLPAFEKNGVTMDW